MAAASFAVRRARSIPGMAIAAMIPVIAITISSSVKVKPECPKVVRRLQFWQWADMVFSRGAAISNLCNFNRLDDNSSTGDGAPPTSAASTCPAVTRCVKRKEEGPDENVGSEHPADGHVQRADTEKQDHEDAARSHVADRLEEHLLAGAHVELNCLPVEGVADAQSMRTRLKLTGDRISPEQRRDAFSIHPHNQLPRLEILL